MRRDPARDRAALLSTIWSHRMSDLNSVLLTVLLLLGSALIVALIIVVFGASSEEEARRLLKATEAKVGDRENGSK